MRGGDTTAALDLLDRAGATLLCGCRADTTSERYLQAHLGALRAGAALLASRRYRRGGPSSVWEAVTALTPELAEWAEYFALCGQRRNALERGDAPATAREADDLLRSAETFLGLVQAALGLPVTPIGPALAVAGRR